MDDRAQPSDITFFAETNFRGLRRRFGIFREDRRKHVYIIGKTGMGKSTLLENMTIQDIQAGRGIAVVDPHGEYAERVIDFVPKHRINDVVYFNPADINFPVGFNIMERVAEDQRHLVSSGLLGVFKKIWPDVWSPRMEYLLANAILALLETPGSTLLGVNRIFGEKDFRKRIVSQLNDPIIRGFWENEFAKYPEQFMREAVAAIQNKVGQFASNPLIRNIIGQVESSINMREIMDEEKILIINLAKGRIGEENSRLLGAMMVTKLYLTAMGRVDVPETERKDFYLYVDEFQNFATESFANILSEARKYRLNLTVAHQYIMQMEEMVQHAIFGNVGTMISFRVGAEDAELLEKEFMPEFTGQDLVNLGFKNAYVKLMIQGITSRPFSAETLRPMTPPEESFRDAIIRVSRERYSTPRAQVEEKIRRFTASGITSDLGTPSDAPGATQSSDMPMRPSAPVRADRKMYETTCAVDGKPILVPFEPDGRRPVYCEEHMNMIKFRSKGEAGGSEARGEATTSPVMRRNDIVQREEPRYSPRSREPLSLNALRPRAEAAVLPQLRSHPTTNQSQSKEAALIDLRRALAESLQREKPTPPPAEVAPRAKDAPRILAPSETIRLE